MRLINRVLQKNLDVDRTDDCGINWLMRDIFNVHLGVADKSMLINYLNQNDHSCFTDLVLDISLFLESMGYESRYAKRLINGSIKEGRRMLEAGEW